eukprot:Clim_evm57s108 gene=Clim_evmTU57s108
MAPLPILVTRGLNDKLYDRRKIAALEVERIVKEALHAEDQEHIQAIVAYIRKEFAYSPTANARKGGLIALAAIAIAMGPDNIKDHIHQIVPPALACFQDPDSRIRYYACEALYNIMKVARYHILEFFNDIFDSLSRLAADPDPNVKNGAELTDRLLKDVVIESTFFDVQKFIPLLKERIQVIDPFVRQFVVSWIDTLDGVPDIDLVEYLPEFLDGLFMILSDPKTTLQTQTQKQLEEFLREIESSNRVNYRAMITIVIKHCNSRDFETRQMALTWLFTFTRMYGTGILAYLPDILRVVLPYLSSPKAQLKSAAKDVNQALLHVIERPDECMPPPTINDATGDEEKVDLESELKVGPVIKTLNLQLLDKATVTRREALLWYLTLHRHRPDDLLDHVDEFFPPLLKTLCDTSNEVVLKALEILAEICCSTEDSKGTLNGAVGTAEQQPYVPQVKVKEHYFDRFVKELINLFAEDKDFLLSRGSFIVKKACTLMPARALLSSLATNLTLERVPDEQIICSIVQLANYTLLTAGELQEVRNTIKELDSVEAVEFFSLLYKCWSVNPISLFSLCLLAQKYEHAYKLIVICGTLEINVQFLIEVDKLVQMLESPIFAYLRLQLLEPAKHPYLLQCLYGILMILPQSPAFTLLQNRLSAVPPSMMTATHGEHRKNLKEAATDRSPVTKKKSKDKSRSFFAKSKANQDEVPANNNEGDENNSTEDGLQRGFGSNPSLLSGRSREVSRDQTGDLDFDDLLVHFMDVRRQLDELRHQNL